MTSNAESPGNDLGSPIVTVEASLCHENAQYFLFCHRKPPKEAVSYQLSTIRKKTRGLGLLFTSQAES